LESTMPNTATTTIVTDLNALADATKHLDRRRAQAMIREDMQARWQRGERATVEAYLKAMPALAEDAEVGLDLIYQEIVLREKAGEKPGEAEYCVRFPRWAEMIEQQFALHRMIDLGLDDSASSTESFTLEANARNPFDALARDTTVIPPPPGASSAAKPTKPHETT
jgi:hypothetical protein